MTGLIWSDYQRAVIDHIRTGSGSALVDARAGASKTTVIVEAAKELYTSCWALAFNTRTCEELVCRINFMTAVQPRTLNSLGWSTLLNNGFAHLEIDKRREWQRARRVTDIGFPGLAYQEAAPVIRQLVSLVEYAKNTLQTEEGQLRVLVKTKGCVGDADKIVEMVREMIKEALEDKAKISFTDQVWLAVVRNLPPMTCDTVLVDEYQDLSPMQLVLVERAVNPGGRLILVGDEKQNIYGWRGADAGAVDRVIAKFGPLKRFSLPISYRLPLAGIALAKRLVPDIEPRPGAPEGSVVWAPVSGVMAAGPGDVVLSRVNAPLLKLCIRFLRDGKRASVAGKDVGGGIEDLIKDSKARSVGDLLAWLQDYQAEEKERLIPLDNPELLEVLEDRVETTRALAEGLRRIEDVQARIKSLFHDESKNGSLEDQILLSTTHKYKGFECRRTFILHETYFKPVETVPAEYRDLYPRALDHAGREWLPVPKGEEQNVYYVTTSRFKEELVCCGGPPPGFLAGVEEPFTRLTPYKKSERPEGEKESPKPQQASPRPGAPQELQWAMDANPEADFVMSCAEQWQETGRLSEKQLSGLARWGRRLWR